MALLDTIRDIGTQAGNGFRQGLDTGRYILSGFTQAAAPYANRFDFIGSGAGNLSLDVATGTPDVSRAGDLGLDTPRPATATTDKLGMGILILGGALLVLAAMKGK